MTLSKINVVLFQPEIPPNTGNIARLCVCNDLKLHLIHPLGFSLDKKQVKRAGLDYWEHLELEEYANWSAFLQKHKSSPLFFFSSKAQKSLWEVTFPPECYLIFGSETKGFSREITEDFKDCLVTLPMEGKNARCLNLSTSAGIGVYEALRQHRNLGCLS